MTAQLLAVPVSDAPEPTLLDFLQKAAFAASTKDLESASRAQRLGFRYIVRLQKLQDRIEAVCQRDEFGDLIVPDGVDRETRIRLKRMDRQSYMISRRLEKAHELVGRIGIQSLKPMRRARFHSYR